MNGSRLLAIEREVEQREAAMALAAQEEQAAELERVHRAHLSRTPAYIELRQILLDVIERENERLSSASATVEIYRAQGAIQAARGILRCFEKPTIDNGVDGEIEPPREEEAEGLRAEEAREEGL